METFMKGLSDAEAYQAIYGDLVFVVPFYQEHFLIREIKKRITLNKD